MQIKNNHPNYLHKPWIIGLAKLLLLGGCLFFLITRFKEQSVSLDQMNLPDEFDLVLCVVLVLMFINWYLEALRWKISLKPFEFITMSEAWKVVLGGLALNWILPFTSGDLVTRVSRQKDKYQTTSAAVLNRGMMLFFTLTIGLFGLSYLADGYQWNWWLGGVGASLVLIGYLVRKSLSRFLQYFDQLSKYAFIQIASISLLRYIVFVVQFFLLLHVFLPMLSADLLVAGIGWIFLVRSILPMFFGGVGVREASGILFFEPHVNDLQLALIPIFLIWIINTVLPSLIGLVFVWQLKPALNN